MGLAVMAIRLDAACFAFFRICAGPPRCRGATPGAWAALILDRGAAFGLVHHGTRGDDDWRPASQKAFSMRFDPSGESSATRRLGRCSSMFQWGHAQPFVAPPAVMVAQQWNWGFGEHAHGLRDGKLWRASWPRPGRSRLPGGMAAPWLGALRRRREQQRPIPWSVTMMHLLFIACGIKFLLSPDHAPLVILGLLFFVYVEAAARHQQPLNLRGVLRRFFSAGAGHSHGGCQQWWIKTVPQQSFGDGRS